MSYQRNKGLDVLRVLAMLLVVLAHFLGWGTAGHHGVIGVPSFSNGHVLNAIAYPLLSVFANMGVLLFVLISGYFLSKSTVLRLDKLFSVWIQGLFYSVGITCIFSIIGGCPWRNVASALFPIGSDVYWFVTKYVALLVLAPFLTILINGLDKRGHSILLIVLTLLVVTITSGFPYGNVFFSDNPLSVAMFVYVFIISSWLRRFGIPAFLRQYGFWIFFACVAFQWLGGLALNWYHADSGNIWGGFSSEYNALTIVPAVSLFCMFLSKDWKGSLLINSCVRIAPYTFAVYLIHDHPLVREYLWNSIFNPANYWTSPMWLCYAIVVPIVVLAIGVLIDMLRFAFFKVIRIMDLSQKVSKLNITIIN